MAWDLIGVKDIKKYEDRKDAIMIDIRDEKDYKNGHIPKMININKDNILKDHEIIKKYNIIIFCCEKGNNGLILARKMDKLYKSEKHFYNIYGGYKTYLLYQKIL